MAEQPAENGPQTLADLLSAGNAAPDLQEVPDDAREALRNDLAAFGAGLWLRSPPPGAFCLH